MSEPMTDEVIGRIRRTQREPLQAECLCAECVRCRDTAALLAEVDRLRAAVATNHAILIVGEAVEQALRADRDEAVRLLGKAAREWRAGTAARHPAACVCGVCADTAAFLARSRP